MNFQQWITFYGRKTNEELASYMLDSIDHRGRYTPTEIKAIMSVAARRLQLIEED